MSENDSWIWGKLILETANRFFFYRLPVLKGTWNISCMKTKPAKKKTLSGQQCICEKPLDVNDTRSHEWGIRAQGYRKQMACLTLPSKVTQKEMWNFWKGKINFLTKNPQKITPQRPQEQTTHIKSEKLPHRCSGLFHAQKCQQFLPDNVPFHYRKCRGSMAPKSAETGPCLLSELIIRQREW